jgi:ankyrin repeat protein
MNSDETTIDLVPQRYQRPLNIPPGFLKKFLATKYLEVGSKGDIEALRQLLAQHPEFLNKRGPNNRTLLWEAARRGKLPAVRWLVEQGAEIDATGAYNHESLIQLTPYCATIYYHRFEVAVYLRSQGAREDIFRAVFLGDLGQVDRELAAQPELINAEDPHDFVYYMPLLAFAVVGGQAEMAKFLLRRGASVAPYSALLLGLAVRNTRRDFIDLLVSHGADVRALGADTFVATTDLEIMRYLFQHGVSASRTLENGFPPLVYLARGDKGEHPEKIRLLLEHGAPVNARGPKGRTALHYASAAGFIRVIALLLDYGADISLKDDEGNMPLDLARRGEKIAAAAMLEERGGS